MRPHRIVTPQDAAEIFDLAVRDRALAVLSVLDGQHWITFKSRFLERDPGRRFFVLDYQTQTGLPNPPLQAGQYVGVSFRHKSRKVLFSTVVEAKGHYVLDQRETVPAVRYRWPATMIELQRRAYNRTPVPESQHVDCRLWPGSLEQNAEPPADTCPGTLANVSCGGAMIRIADGPQMVWTENVPLVVELALPDGRPPLRLDAYCRGYRPDDQGQPGVALQFIGLELSNDGRANLQRLANFVQRLNRVAMTFGIQKWTNTRERGPLAEESSESTE